METDRHSQNLPETPRIFDRLIFSPDLTVFQHPQSSWGSSSSDLTGMLESAMRSLGTTRVTSKVAFSAGSSQHGKARRASVASNWVQAKTRSSPSGVL